MREKMSVLAFDIGASNGRAIVGRFDGEHLELEVVHSFPNGGVEIHGENFWNVLGLFKAIKEGLLRVEQETDDNVTSLGIDTWGVDYGLLDRADNLLSFPYHYRDDRTNGVMEEVFAHLPREELYWRTGIQFIKFNTLFQLWADRKYRPWILDHAEGGLLFTPDLLNFFLTGEKYNEYTIASTSQMFSPRENDWAREVLEKLGLPQDIMQPMIHPGNELGRLTDRVQAECGIARDIPVMAVASHDTASAVAATPLEDRENSVYISSGTWSLLGMELESPIINEESLAENFTNECGIGQRIRFLKNISGLWLIQQCRESWEKQGHSLTYDEISGMAEQAAPFKFRLDPDDPRFMNPDDMPSAIADYCRETGQPVPQTRAEMARGIYESLALSYRDTIARLEKIVDREIETIHMVGGGIKAELLCHFTACATGKRVVTGPAEATATGNIIAQLMASGAIDSLEEGRELVRNSVSLREYNPDSAEGWD